MNETTWGLYVGGVSNLAVAAVLNNSAWEPSASDWLVTIGIFNELLGVLMVASPELLPRARLAMLLLKRLSARTVAMVAQWLSRLLGLRRDVVVPVGTAVSRANALPIEVVQSGTPPGLTTEELLGWLVEQFQRLRNRVTAIESSIERMPERWREDITKTREELATMQDALERRLANRNIRLRLLGLSYVLIGLVLSWAGNLV